MGWIYAYLGIIVCALIIEFVTSEMVSIWFVGGGVICMILSALGVMWQIHLPIFIVISIVLLLCFRKLVMKYFVKSDVKTNADSAIGKEFVLLSNIGFNQAGTIKINDVIWSAVTENQKDDIAQGEIVTVIGLKGNKYIVKKKEI